MSVAGSNAGPESPGDSRRENAAPGIPLFSVRKVVRRFGALIALDDVSFHVRRSEILGIAGPNGAGKSTLLNVCGGSLAPASGEITLEGERVEGLPPYRMCHRGLGRTFQIPQVFSSMSVEENIAVGRMFGGGDAVAAGDIVRFLVDVCGLAARRDEPAGKVSLMTRKMIMLAAVLATRPKLVFLDEPLAGLNREEIQVFMDLISRLRDEMSLTFVVVEHKIRALSQLSDRLMVIHFGRCICLDTPEVVIKDAQVVDVYLGTEFDA